jgi:hypothetical protein
MSGVVGWMMNDGCAKFDDVKNEGMRDEATTRRKAGNSNAHNLSRRHLTYVWTDDRPNITWPTSLDHFTCSISLRRLNQNTKTLTINMSGLQHDIHYERYRECAALYNEKKWKECTEVARRNMAYCTMPRYLQVKTLLVLIGAEEHSWYKAEVDHHHHCPPEDLS